VSQTESELIAHAAAGEPRAVEALVNQHMPRVYALAYRMLGQAQEAEDVTQDTFIKAWKILPDWQPKAKFSTWLHRVALNLCRDRLRKKREVLSDEVPEQIDTALRPEQALAQSQRHSALEAAISDLPERQREAITLCALQEMTNIEAAEIMQVSIDALESLLARGRRGLKTALASNEDLRP